MGKGNYFSKYTGKQLDEAIDMILSAGIDNLLHDRGVFETEEELPILDVKTGDFAYVGTDYASMSLYRYKNGAWSDTGQKVDLNNKTGVTVTQALGDSALFVISQKTVTEYINRLTPILLPASQFENITPDEERTYYVYEDDATIQPSSKEGLAWIGRTVLLFTESAERPSTPIGGSWHPETNVVTLPEGKSRWKTVIYG